MSDRLPKHVYRKPDGTLYVRFVFPSDITKRYKPPFSQIRFSLKTDSVKKISSFISVFGLKRVQLVCYLREKPEISNPYFFNEIKKWMKDMDIQSLGVNIATLATVKFPDGTEITLDSGDDDADAKRATNSALEYASKQPAIVKVDDNVSVKTIDAVFEIYKQHKVRSGDWANDNTRKNREFRWSQIKKCLDTNKNWHELNRNDARIVKDHVLQLPNTVVKKEKRFITAQTAKAVFEIFSGMCRFAYQEGYHERNFCEGIGIKVKEKTSVKKIPSRMKKFRGCWLAVIISVSLLIVNVICFLIISGPSLLRSTLVRG